MWLADASIDRRPAFFVSPPTPESALPPYLSLTPNPSAAILGFFGYVEFFLLHSRCIISSTLDIQFQTSTKSRNNANNSCSDTVVGAKRDLESGDG